MGSAGGESRRESGQGQAAMMSREQTDLVREAPVGVSLERVPRTSWKLLLCCAEDPGQVSTAEVGPRPRGLGRTLLRPLRWCWGDARDMGAAWPGFVGPSAWVPPAGNSGSPGVCGAGKVVVGERAPCARHGGHAPRWTSPHVKEACRAH